MRLGLSAHRPCPQKIRIFTSGPVPGLPAPLHSGTGDVPMIGFCTNIIVCFLDRPGLKLLDLLTDLGGFLVAAGVYASTGSIIGDAVRGGMSSRGTSESCVAPRYNPAPTRCHGVTVIP